MKVKKKKKNDESYMIIKQKSPRNTVKQYKNESCEARVRFVHNPPIEEDRSWFPMEYKRFYQNPSLILVPSGEGPAGKEDFFSVEPTRFIKANL